MAIQETTPTYHIEYLKEQWIPYNGPLNLTEARTLLKERTTASPLCKWRIVQTKVVEEIWEEYTPGAKKIKKNKSFKLDLIEEQKRKIQELKQTIEQLTNSVASNQISTGK